MRNPKSGAPAPAARSASPAPAAGPASAKRGAATRASAKPRASADDPAPQPDGPAREELIRRRAYDRYERNGCIDGHALDDWLAAEAEVGAITMTGEAGQARASGVSG